MIGTLLLLPLLILSLAACGPTLWHRQAQWDRDVRAYNTRIHQFNQEVESHNSSIRVLKKHPAWPGLMAKLDDMNAKVAVEPEQAKPDVVRAAVAGMTEDELKLLNALFKVQDQQKAIDAKRTTLQDEAGALSRERANLDRRFRLVQAALSAPSVTVQAPPMQPAMNLTPSLQTIRCTSTRFGAVGVVDCY